MQTGAKPGRWPPPHAKSAGNPAPDRRHTSHAAPPPPAYRSRPGGVGRIRPTRACAAWPIHAGVRGIASRYPTKKHTGGSFTPPCSCRASANPAHWHPAGWARQRVVGPPAHRQTRPAAYVGPARSYRPSRLSCAGKIPPRRPRRPAPLRRGHYRPRQRRAGRRHSPRTTALAELAKHTANGACSVLSTSWQRGSNAIVAEKDKVESSSFLKKRTKKLLSISGAVNFPGTLGFPGNLTQRSFLIDAVDIFS